MNKRIKNDYKNGKNRVFCIENTQTIKKSKKIPKRACQCERDLYNAPSLTRQGFEECFSSISIELAR